MLENLEFPHVGEFLEDNYIIYNNTLIIGLWRSQFNRVISNLYFWHAVESYTFLETKPQAYGLTLLSTFHLQIINDRSRVRRRSLARAARCRDLINSRENDIQSPTFRKKGKKFLDVLKSVYNFFY